MGSGASKEELVMDPVPSHKTTPSQAPVKQQLNSEPTSTRGRPPINSIAQTSNVSQMNRKPLPVKICRQLSRSSNLMTGKEATIFDAVAAPNWNSLSRFIEGYEEASVSINKTGFSVQTLLIMEGQSVQFIWDDDDTINYNLIQVVHDGEKLRPVIGGFGCTQKQASAQSMYEQQFNLEGDYKFAISGIRCTPLTVTVRPRVDLNAGVTDAGFNPELIYIDQGHTVLWSWKNCSIPHAVQEVKYCTKHGSFLKEDNSNASTVMGSVTGYYRHEFKRAGLYYFQTASSEVGNTHLSIVYVRQAPREHKVEVLDRTFHPMVVLIEEGDRVWWQWDRFKCKNPHSVYQVEPPKIGYRGDEAYEPVENGFRWATPSKQGFMGHDFYQAGVYYFSDQAFDEAAEYIGTIIVKPKQREHYLQLTENGFSPELVYAQTGDRLWWMWPIKSAHTQTLPFTICEIDRCVNPGSKLTLTDCNDRCQFMNTAATKLCMRMGYSTVTHSAVGVYQYRVADSPNSFNTCSVIVNPGHKNYTIHLTDNGFEPKVLTVRPNDRVWWVWQGGKIQHNVVQVSRSGIHVPADEGFCSGALRDPPSAYTHQFHSQGVFYFISSNLPKVLGAIVVSTQPQVHEINVGTSEIKPDPCVVNVNDVVCWIHRGLRNYDVQSVETVDQILDTQLSGTTIAPRRCISRAIQRTGIQHFCSKSFQRQRSKDHIQERGSKEEMRLSSILSDDHYEHMVIRLDKHGFHPNVVNIQKSQGVLWTWRGSSDEQHNIIHVSSPESQTPLSVVQGTDSFNSGKPEPSGRFAYTFDEVASFTVASQGAPGFSCTVHVLNNATRTAEPCISSTEDGGTVDRFYKVSLACKTPDAKIYYTTDGSPPERHSESIKLYNPDKGVILRETGLCFVRALASSQGRMQSFQFISKRFWVLSTDRDEDRISETSDDGQKEEVQQIQAAGVTTKSWKWWGCIPTLKGVFTGPGVMEVFWDEPPPDARDLILGYQVYLNEVLYWSMFPLLLHGLNVVGLAGGRVYDIYVEVYPVDTACAVQHSNKLTMKCPIVTSDGGPVISLERGDRDDALVIVWMALSADDDIGYKLFLNDQQCGQQLVPNPENNRCKVVIDGCELRKLYKVFVQAVKKDGVIIGYSNVHEVMLPLDCSHITLPPLDRRVDDPDLYSEFIEIREGSGYLPAEQVVHNKVTEPIPLTAAPPTPVAIKEEPKTRESLWRSALPVNKPPSIPLPRQPAQAPDTVSKSPYAGAGASNRCVNPLTMMKCVKKLRTLSRATLNVSDSPITFESGNSSRRQSQTGVLDTEVNGPFIENSLAIEVKTYSPTQRKFKTFKQVGKMIRDFVAVDLRLRRCIAPGNRRTERKIDWEKLRGFVKAGNVTKKQGLKTFEVRRDFRRHNIQPGLSTLEAEGYRDQMPPVAGNALKYKHSMFNNSSQLQIPGQSVPIMNDLTQWPSKPKMASFARRPSMPTAKDLDWQSNAIMEGFVGAARNQRIPPWQMDAYVQQQQQQQQQQFHQPITVQNSYQAYTGQAYYSRLFQGMLDSGHTENGVSSASEDWRSEDQEVMTEEQEIPIPRDGSDLNIKQQHVQIRRDIAVGTESSESSSDSDMSHLDNVDNDDVTTEDKVMVIDATCTEPVGKTKRKRRPLTPGPGVRRAVTPETGEKKDTHVIVPVNDVSDAVQSSSAPLVAGAPVKNHRKRKEKSGAAVVEVDETVEYNMEEEQYDDGRQRVHVTRLPAVKAVVPPSAAGVTVNRPDLEGQFIVSDGDGILPAPSIMVESRNKTSVRVFWELPRDLDPEYQLLIYVVNVIGEKFDKTVNSDISFEALMEDRGAHVAGVQHCWNVSAQHAKCTVHGVLAGYTYRVYVVANYTLVHGQQPSEIQTTSSVLYYTTMDPPKAPELKIVSADRNQVCLEWFMNEVHQDVRIKGYRVLIDGKPLGSLQPSHVHQLVINNMIPGKTLSVCIQAIARHPGYDSEPSLTLHLTCPRQPTALVINQQPSYKRGCVLVAWDKAVDYGEGSGEEDVSQYIIYVDGKWYGEIRANMSSNKRGYQYFLTDLTPGQSYDVAIKAIAGPRKLDTEARHIFCLCESQFSNTLPVTAPAAPMSPKLRIDGLHPEGIDVTWQMPQQYGDAAISGYQMLKNGKLYGSIIPPDVNSLRIRDVVLGEKIMLQLIALTDHPVGKTDGPSTDRDSGIDGSSHPDEKDFHLNEKYSGCRPGGSLVIHYTGLVLPPTKVWCEKVTGHSALVVWRKENHPKTHFIVPESYQVTWWPGDRAEQEINSDSTTDDHLLITGLHPATAYTVVVEARKMQRYTDMDEEAGDMTNEEGVSAFILTGKSDHLTLETARPPDPARNLGVVTTTCSSLKVAWDPPREHGVEVIGVRVDCTPLTTRVSGEHKCVDVMPDVTIASFENLQELTEYLVTVTAVTDEYFDLLPDKHRLKKLRILPKDMRVSPKDSIWLPCATALAKTSGTDAPSNVQALLSTMSSITINWLRPLVHGSNKLQGIIVRWTDIKSVRDHNDGDLLMSNHINLLSTDESMALEGLSPGTQYRIVVEAVVSVKTSLEPDSHDSGIEKYRRTAHVMSEALFARTRAPTEPPRILVTSFTHDTISLYWEKPMLMSVTGRNEDDQPKYLKRYLEGYKLEINGRPHMVLDANAQSCTLTKCRSGKTYNIVLVALSCTEEVRRDRKKKTHTIQTVSSNSLEKTDLKQRLDDENLDESPSDTITLTVPKSQPGFIANISATFEPFNDSAPSETFGDISLSWTIQGETTILRQFNVLWFNEDDRIVHTKYVGPEQSRCTIPVTKHKCIYIVSVEPTYYTDVITQPPPSTQIIIPGPPDSPEIFLKSVDPEEFIIEWGEPRLFGGVKIRGYQVFMNDRKAGNELSPSHRKAVIPCRSNRHYKIHLVALSTDLRYGDSGKSNALLVSTGPRSAQGNASSMLTLEDWASSMADGNEISMTVMQVTDSSIHLDWTGHVDTEDVSCYKVQWSSIAQPAQREVKLSAKDSSCVISKCLPGTRHFVRIVSIGMDGNIVDKSKQMTVQTSAQPDTPILTTRSCNFRYIAVQWDKPSAYGEATITGYKVYINGVVEAILNSDQLNFTLTHGNWCQEYSFQVQALTGHEKLNSKASDPLVITWPGVKAPNLYRIPTVSTKVLRIGWEYPFITEGIKIKHYRLVCVDGATNQTVHSLGPLHPDTLDGEIKGVKRAVYILFLEIHLHGTNEMVKSEPLYTEPALAPDPPVASVTVVGLEERRVIQRVTCDLVNKRDRLIRHLGDQLKRHGASSPFKVIGKDQDLIVGAQNLSHVEELLEVCFATLAQYTGQLLAHVSWTCKQSNPDMDVSGYRVMVNGKQYGSTMNAGIKNVRIKLNLEQPCHELSIVATSDQPQMTSEESNAVELLTDAFQPFAFYCYHGVHKRETRWPNSGCCRYEDSIAYERQLAKKLANQGLLKRQVPPPSCSLLDIFDGEFKPLLTHNKLRHPTALLFWTPWCLSSKSVVSHFVRFAGEASKEYNFIAVTCGYPVSTPVDRQHLVHLITENAWRDDNTVWHCTSQCASMVREVATNIRKTTGHIVDPYDDTETPVDLTELLGIAGVPTLLFVHPEGYITWHGRYSAYDYSSFSAFMRHTFTEVLGEPCPVIGCDSCQNSMAVEPEITDILCRFDRSLIAGLRHPVANSLSVSMPSMDETLITPYRQGKPLLNLLPDSRSHSRNKKHSPDRLFNNKSGNLQRMPRQNSDSRISVSTRPFSASAPSRPSNDYSMESPSHSLKESTGRRIRFTNPKSSAQKMKKSVFSTM